MAGAKTPPSIGCIRTRTGFEELCCGHWETTATAQFEGASRRREFSSVERGRFFVRLLVAGSHRCCAPRRRAFGLRPRPVCHTLQCHSGPYVARELQPLRSRGSGRIRQVGLLDEKSATVESSPGTVAEATAAVVTAAASTEASGKGSASPEGSAPGREFARSAGKREHRRSYTGRRHHILRTAVAASETAAARAAG